MIFGLCVIDVGISQKPDLGLVYQWTQLEFDYPNAKARQDDIDSGNFDPTSAAPIDVDVHYSCMFFLLFFFFVRRKVEFCFFRCSE